MTEHNYIDGVKSVKRKEGLLVDVETADGTVYENVAPHRLFPLSNAYKYIALINENEEEVAIIRSAGGMTKEDSETLDDVLREYYMIPRITEINSITEKFGRITFAVETDHGPREFEIQNRQHDIITMSPNRVLIVDTSDNRYEIPDLSALDKKSLHRILPQI